MPLFTEHKIAEIKQAADIVAIVGEYLPLKRAGRSFKALCPFHDDKNPSLNVNPERQIFKCFACGEGGDVIRFVQARERVSFAEAVRLLARKVGVVLDEATSPAAKRQQAGKDLLYRTCQWACEQYHHHLLNGHDAADARAYLRERQISQDSVREFRLGFAPAGWDWLIRQAGSSQIPMAQLVAAGLASQRRDGDGHYDRLHGQQAGRIVFPICDTQSRPVGFGARTLTDETPKYLNSPDTALFNKSRLLYGLDRARRHGLNDRQVILVEGYTDCIMAHQLGLPCAVGTMGTALTREHVQLLKRYAETIVLVFDGDEAGQRAADRGLDLFFEQEVDVRILLLPDGQDPCEFLLARGVDALRSLMATSPDALEFKLAWAAQHFDLESVEGRRRALDSVLAALARVPEAPRTTQRLKQDLVLGALADRFRIDERGVRSRLAELRRRERPRADAPTAPADDTQGAPPDPVELELAEIILADSAYVATLRNVLDLDALTDPSLRRIVEACFELDASGTEPTLDALVARLQDGELIRLATLCREHGLEKGNLARRLEDAVRVLRERERQHQTRDLRKGLTREFVPEKESESLERLKQLQQKYTSR